jgi:hypothetical protein
MTNLLKGDLALLLDLGKLFDGLGGEQRRLYLYLINLYSRVSSFSAPTYNVKNTFVASSFHKVQFRVGMRQNALGARTNIKGSREVVAKDLSS